jgi:hypothetical protein
MPNQIQTPATEIPGSPGLSTAIPAMSISGLARLVRRDWKNIYFGAKPYLDAMGCLETVADNFGADPGREIVNYFLANAQTWRGPMAKAVKAELNKRVKSRR